MRLRTVSLALSIDAGEDPELSSRGVGAAGFAAKVVECQNSTSQEAAKSLRIIGMKLTGSRGGRCSSNRSRCVSTLASL